MASILNIGERLEAIVDLCPTTKKIADIGCDHGYVSCELVLQNKAEMVVASEKSVACLNKAVALADSINIMPFISFRQGDGFEAITKYDKLNCAVIAGMGGLEIIKILKNRPKKLFDFVLQPQSDVILLRKYLIENKFNILVDKLVKEGDKYYNVIRVTKGKCNLADLELYFGKTNFTDNYVVFYEYLTMRQKKLLDLKAEIGGLSNSLQQELDYVNSAISLFETSSDQTNN
ncbi:MAG: tRNA (adenine(22)-N(1))-methyltransferase [Christensenellales bacterium]